MRAERGAGTLVGTLDGYYWTEADKKSSQDVAPTYVAGQIAGLLLAAAALVSNDHNLLRRKTADEDGGSGGGPAAVAVAALLL